MAGSVNEDYGAGGSSSLTEGMSSDQRCLSADALAEWRSSEQVENGTPSTSPPYWDTDEDDDDSGLKPSELYGKHTWKIENFSQINKRELKSDAFEIGGYKWYILIYPQGCDVSNHLSLFLCVANHDKLLPGWSHFAQFTIAVVNKDPKKTKYSDTLHRFWKKEHDWGWKKFMELSKVSDGFVVTDDLVIKAQVQVIREKANRPFRCLDRHYRRELVRIYLTNVEQICRRFVEEKRSKLCKLIEDKMRWSSFHAFWLGIDQNAKRQMSRDKTEAILKVVVKQFFIEKEVTSTLVMDSLYSGLRALECQSKKERAEAEDLEELPVPMVHIENDMFVLADDVLRLLERAALQPLPHQPLPTKDEKSSQSRAKDGLSGEDFSRDSIVRDEKRLTELGRRTVEIFVLAHIFSRIEVAYQEAVALKRQEELIREEEAAGQIENGLKTKRAAAEKEKRAKKKQAKQKKNSRKGKNKGRDEKSDLLMQVKRQLEIPSGGRILEGYASRNSQTVIEKIEALEEASVVSDMGDDVPESLQPELEDRDNSSTNWDTDTSERHHAAENSINERETWRTDKTSPSVIDDSCSTCSTDSVPSVAINGSYKGNSLPKNTGQSSPIRIKDQQSRDLDGLTGSNRGGNIKTSNATSEAAHLSDDADSYTDPQHEPEAVTLSNKERLRRDDHHLVDKEVAANLQKKVHGKDYAVEQSSKSRAKDSSSSQSTPGNKLTSASRPANKSSESSAATASKIGPVFSKEASLLNTSQTKKSIPTATKSLQAASVTEAEKGTTPSKNTASHQVPAMSRPLSTPLIPPPRSSAPIVSTVQTMPLLSRSVSASGRLGTVPSPSASSYIPQSYRNAIIGKTTTGPNATSSTHTFTTSSSQAVMYSQPPSTFISPAPMLSQSSAINSQTSLRPGLTFGSVNHEALQNQQPWRRDYSNQQATSSGQHDLNFVRETNRLNIGGNSLGKQPFGVVSSNVNSDQAQRIMSDEFPHLAIINDLLDEDQSGSCQASHHLPLNRHYTFPRDYSSVDVGSLSGPGHYEQADLYYGDGVHGVYGSSNGALHGLRDANLGQMDILGYANGHVEGMNHNQWPYMHADLSMLSLGSVDANGYQYQLSDHLNSGRGENGYNMYHPSSGF